LTGVRVGAFRDGEVGHAGVEGCVDPGVAEVVFGGSDRGCAAFSLGGERVDGEDTVLRLAELCVALFCGGFRLL
jgi:hypothetical protein